MTSFVHLHRHAWLLTLAAGLLGGTAWADARTDALIARVSNSSLQFYDRLGAMDELARDGVKEAIPALVAVMHDYDDDESPVYSIGFMCHTAKSLARLAPQDPAVIDAIAATLEQERLQTSKRLERCDCLLEALAEIGPAAAPRAGALVAWFATAPQLDSQWTLPKVVAALGLEVSQAPSLIQGIREGLRAETRAALMRALLVRAAELRPTERESLRAIAREWCRDDDVRLYLAGAEALGTLGRAGDVPVLEAMLRDRSYVVRRSAIEALGALGPEVVSDAAPLVQHLDPFLGTVDVTAKALVGLRGVGARAIGDARRRLQAGPATDAATRVRSELLAALLAATSTANLDEFNRTLASRAPSLAGRGHYLVEVLREGRGAAYAPGQRLELSFSAFEYPRQPGAGRFEAGRVRVDEPSADFHRVLFGLREGGQYRVTVAPQIRGTPYSGTGTHDSQYRLRDGSPFVYELKLENVCRPRTLTLFKGGGKIPPLAVEAWCW